MACHSVRLADFASEMGFVICIDIIPLKWYYLFVGRSISKGTIKQPSLKRKRKRKRLQGRLFFYACGGNIVRMNKRGLKCEYEDKEG
jgi:hypothetical protein